MKFLLSATFLLFCLENFAQQQTPFFEQIAFDYFKKEIITKEKIENKLYVNDSISSYGKPFDWLRCFKTYKSDDLLSTNASHQTIIEIMETKNSKIFKATKRHKSNCNVVESIDMKNGNHIVNIVVYGKYHGDVYHIEMDEKGNILKWCKGGWVE